MSDSIEKARIPPNREDDHPTLFSLAEFSNPRPSCQSICKEIGLNWMAALKLHEDGWLSFDPKTTEELKPWLEAELRFVGALVIAGCDGSILKNMLLKLEKPYSYHIDRVYYDWTSQTWRLLEDVDDLDEKFDEWLEELVAWQELNVLEALGRRLDNAILYVRGRQGLPLKRQDQT